VECAGYASKGGVFLRGSLGRKGGIQASLAKGASCAEKDVRSRALERWQIVRMVRVSKRSNLGKRHMPTKYDVKGREDQAKCEVQMPRGSTGGVW